MSVTSFLPLLCRQPLLRVPMVHCCRTMSKKSFIEINAQEIKNPDHLGQDLKFPEFHGTGLRLKDRKLVRNARHPPWPSPKQRMRSLDAAFEEYLTKPRYPAFSHISHRFNGWEEVCDDIETAPGLFPSTEPSNQTIQNVNDDLLRPQRLFAVIFFGGRQFKVTDEDLFVHFGHLPAENGDKVLIEKVLLVGGENFTLVGMPVLRRGLVKIEATVLEKTLSHVVNFTRRVPRKFKQSEFRYPHTVVRINSISITEPIS